MARYPKMVIAVIVAAVATIALAGCTSSGDDTTGGKRGASGPAGQGPEPPDHGAWMGASVMPTDRSSAGRIRAFDDFQQATGRQLDAVHTFHPWDEAFPTDAEEHFLRKGQQLLIGWSFSDCPGVAAGKYDSVIEKRANAVKRLGKPVMITFRQEMDRPNLRSQVRSPEDYIAAWKHTKKIFDDAGATNVGWVWAPTAKGFTEGYAQDYYPGDDQVDWLAVDAYTGPTLRPFSEVVAAFMRFAKQRSDKPVMIAEFGIADRDGRRPGWLVGARWYIKRTPQIKAAFYFNGNDDASEKSQLALQPSASGKQAFNKWLADPYFNTAGHEVGPPR